MASPYDTLCRLTRETALLQSIEALIGWDERTYMPPAAGEYRAEQMTYLAGMIHQRRTDRRIGELLAELVASPLTKDKHSDEATTIRQLRRDYEKQVKLPQSLVEELTRASVLGQQAWVEARKNNDFPSFAPHVKKLFELKRQQAAALGFTGHAYDALLDDFEPDAKTADVAKVLADLRTDLVPLVKAIAEAKKRPDASILTRSYPAAAQEAFGKAAAAACGFDFHRGRLDVTHHPFCSGMGPHDCRITTRYDEHFFPSALFGTLHEAGHGMYDQGLRPELYGLPPGSYVSLGIHESQSRMWENLVGRSRAFWQYFFPQFKETFASARDVSLDDFYFAINGVQPSLIRVEADEATYNLHIIVRFELEQALLSGDLPVDDLPGAWRDMYQQYLGVKPADDTDGCMQDIHWSAALIGYFPTYSLGNLYAAQFFEKADKDLGGLAAQFACGDFTPLKEWLQRNIHHRGQCYTAAELVQLVTGEPLSHAPLIRHLRGKLEPLYGVA
ncbi:MAG: carboxypeptidase M32 [Planctomycetales bacterium]|nr:carboxypeptidase M32 [Planctomycetales bacterium]